MTALLALQEYGTETTGDLGPLGWVVLALVWLVFLAAMVVWVWMLVDAIRRDEGEYRTGTKTIWVLVIALTGIIGALIYYFMARPKRGPRARRHRPDTGYPE